MSGLTVQDQDKYNSVYSDSEQNEIKFKLRSIHCELNCLSRSDGSAFLAQGQTAVLASMHGPIEVKMLNLKINSASVDVTFRPKTGLPTVKDRMRQSLIKSTCETALMTALYPRASISIQLQEMENHSGLEACAINAACLALLISGISMRFTIGAIHCIIDKNNEIILDPDYKQSIGSLASFTFVFDSLKKDLVTVLTNGFFNSAQYNDAMLISKESSEIVFAFYSNIIEKSFKVK